MRHQRWLLMGLLGAACVAHADLWADQGARGGRGPSATDKVRQALEQPITLDFVGQSIHAAVEHVADKANLPLIIDQPALQAAGIVAEDESSRFQVKAKDEKVGQVLRRMLGAYRLTFVLLDDTVLVTTEDGAIQRLLRQTVDVDLHEVTLQKAARDLGRRHSVNVVIDPRLVKQAQAPVTLQLDGVGLETAVRLLAEIADLKSVRLGNVLFITSEDRASRIRKEDAGAADQHLFVPVEGRMLGGIVGNAVRAAPAVEAPVEKKEAAPSPEK